MVAINPLTPRQQLFVMEYVVDLNGKQAAIRAGYSTHTAEVQASSRLRTKGAFGGHGGTWHAGADDTHGKWKTHSRYVGTMCESNGAFR